MTLIINEIRTTFTQGHRNVFLMNKYEFLKEQAISGKIKMNISY